MRRLAALALLIAAPAAAQDAVPVTPARVIATFPHDDRAFTEGLLYHDGALYESTGEPGRSSIRKVDLTTGKVLQSVAIPPPTFGEGIAVWKDQIVSLTWRDHVGWRWTLDGFKKVGTFHYPGEGWALTTAGREIAMSDGTDQIRFLDPATMAEKRRIDVTYNGRKLDQINELEYVDGEILANIWRTNMIARIDPATGNVRGWIDLSGVAAQIDPVNPDDDVPNGIAWDAVGKRLFVTGKDWPTLFQIALPPLPKGAP
ncbi:glutaminyl-peptide cyclotransferase [Sphingomonas koreensis]|nr:glutaminyl-peptide cyclotransferase [Sphingomonas koreensis]